MSAGNSTTTVLLPSLTIALCTLLDHAVCLNRHDLTCLVCRVHNAGLGSNPSWFESTSIWYHHMTSRLSFGSSSSEGVVWCCYCMTAAPISLLLRSGVCCSLQYYFCSSTAILPSSLWMLCVSLTVVRQLDPNVPVNCLTNVTDAQSIKTDLWPASLGHLILEVGFIAVSGRLANGQPPVPNTIKAAVTVPVIVSGVGGCPLASPPVAAMKPPTAAQTCQALAPCT